MNKQDKIKRIIAGIKGEKVEDNSFHFSIIDRTSNPIMFYKDNMMEDGVPITKEELEDYYAGDLNIIEIINDRSQVRK